MLFKIFGTLRPKGVAKIYNKFYIMFQDLNPEKMCIFHIIVHVIYL